MSHDCYYKNMEKESLTLRRENLTPTPHHTKDPCTFANCIARDLFFSTTEMSKNLIC